MPETARNLDQEFWRPPAQTAAPSTAVRPQAEICSRCQTEFVLGSRFCHVCGAAREVQTNDGHGFTQWLDFRVLMEALGLSVGSLIAFIVGLGCVIAALATGMIYTASTALDWQAVQLWRIEWLLAGLTAFSAGILLKRSV